MGILYILQSETSKRFYIGSTQDLDRRLSEHARGHTPSTRGRGPWKLVYTETFETLLEAHRRELQIKAWKSSKMIVALLAATAG
jgi:putative endonuclease